MPKYQRLYMNGRMSEENPIQHWTLQKPGLRKKLLSSLNSISLILKLVDFKAELKICHNYNLKI